MNSLYGTRTTGPTSTNRPAPILTDDDQPLALNKCEIEGEIACLEEQKPYGCGVIQSLKAARLKSYKKSIGPKTLGAVASLTKTDNWRNVFYLGADWLLIVIAIMPAFVLGGATRYATELFPLYLLSILLIGSRMRAIMNLVHQASHNMLFRNKRMNSWVGMMCTSFPLLASLSAYFCAHCRHHQYLWQTTGEPHRQDPKPFRYAQLGLVTPVSDRVQFAKLHILRPMLLFHVPGNILGTVSWEGEPKGERVARIVYWIGILSTFAITQTMQWFVLFWVVPYVTTFQVLRYFGEGAEHAGLKSDSPWLNTRSWTSTWLVEVFMAPHTDHFHIVHHLFPRIPHYRMRAAHQILMKDVPEYAAGHHCDGFFRQRRPDAPSAIQDMRCPEAIHDCAHWLQNQVGEASGVVSRSAAD